MTNIDIKVGILPTQRRIVYTLVVNHVLEHKIHGTLLTPQRAVTHLLKKGQVTRTGNYEGVRQQLEAKARKLVIELCLELVLEERPGSAYANELIAAIQGGMN